LRTKLTRSARNHTGSALESQYWRHHAVRPWGDLPQLSLIWIRRQPEGGGGGGKDGASARDSRGEHREEAGDEGISAEIQARAPTGAW